MISIKDVHKTTQQGKHLHAILNHVTLEILSGEIFGIIGRAGAGKTALLRCLNFLDEPTNGSIIIDNCLVNTLSMEGLRLLRQKIGMLTEDPNLLESRTVYQNVALPLEFNGTKKSEMEHLVNPILRSLALTEMSTLYPHSLNKGQKQRVALARALVLKPRILLCDDITKQLDNKSSHMILQLLREQQEEQNLTIVYVTEEIDVAKAFCQRVAIMHQGEIAEYGHMPQIFVNPTSNIAKELIKSITRLELPTAIRKRMRPLAQENFNPIVRMSFFGNRAHEALIAEAIQKYHLAFHIIQAHLENIQQESLGIMIAEVSGDKNNIQKAIDYFDSKKLYVEVLGYVPGID